VVAAVLLAMERACYVRIARAPEAFRRMCARPWMAGLGSPVTIVAALFGGFKVVQVAVFLGWCHVHGDGRLVPADPLTGVLLGAVALIAGGQVLVLSVFYRLGVIGVFFGDRLGHEVARCRAFPFSWFAHPQYVGTVLTSWGVFLAMRFPHPDWYVLPALETVYYVVGARLEARGPRLRPRFLG
jgi:methylene-fatty-acyl-phospholipid synthase